MLLILRRRLFRIHKYSRELAAYPTPETRANKYWPTCGKVDNTWGDRKLLFTIDSYTN